VPAICSIHQNNLPIGFLDRDPDGSEQKSGQGKASGRK
jgi:hypothetical protein